MSPLVGTGMRVRFGAATDRGRRPNNEDAYLARPPLFLVADGMGGHIGGERASRAVIDAFEPLASRAMVDMAAVRAAFGDAVAAVEALPGEGLAAAGATLTGACLSENDGRSYWLVLNVGDSRTYRLAAGELEQISVDHSVVQELMDAGRLTEAGAETDPRRHVITRAIGAGSSADADYWLIPADQGDRVLICSDGLSGEVAADRLRDALLAEPDPQAAATRLVHEALLHGGHDNITVIVVDALEVSGGEDAQTTPVATPVFTADPDDTVPTPHLRTATKEQP